MRQHLQGRHFVCSTGEAGITTLGVDAQGNSWGWAGFLRKADVAQGSIVRATFDLRAETAELAVVDTAWG